MLEDELLTRLSAAEGSFLGDTALVEKLEHAKRTAAYVHGKVRGRRVAGRGTAGVRVRD